MNPIKRALAVLLLIATLCSAGTALAAAAFASGGADCPSGYIEISGWYGLDVCVKSPKLHGRG